MPIPTDISSLSTTPTSNSPLGSEIVGTQMGGYIQACFAFIATLYGGGFVPTGNMNLNSYQIKNLSAGTATTDAVNLSQLTSTLGSPSGTRVAFNQASAPTGWVIDSSSGMTDCAMRINYSTGGSKGGSSGWSNWNFGGSFSVSGTSLSIAQMPYHNHPDLGHAHTGGDSGHNHSATDTGHQHFAPGGYNFLLAGGSAPSLSGGSGQAFSTTGATPTGNAQIQVGTGYGSIYINQGNANIGYTGSGASHNHTFTTPQTTYTDFVIGIKS